MTAASPSLEALVHAALADVADPEIPAVSIVDLGLVDEVRIDERGIEVALLPTFVGCPALDVIRGDVEARLAQFGRPTRVQFEYRVPWTSDRITARGRDKLRSSGFAPPGDDTCPLCGSRDVAIDSMFGPTQCRSLRYCRSCRQPFEGFKPV